MTGWGAGCMAKIFSIRAATYLSEQPCLYSEEFDGNDFCASHLIGYVDGDPAGCVRMWPEQRVHSNR